MHSKGLSENGHHAVRLSSDFHDMTERVTMQSTNRQTSTRSDRKRKPHECSAAAATIRRFDAEVLHVERTVLTARPISLKLL